MMIGTKRQDCYIGCRLSRQSQPFVHIYLLLRKSFTRTALPSLCGSEPLLTSFSLGVRRISSLSSRVMSLRIFYSSM